MDYIKFVSTPLTSAVCATCMHWGGARIIKNGVANTGASFKGSCESTLEIFEQNNLKDKQKKASYANCKYWVPVKPEQFARPRCT